MLAFERTSLWIRTLGPRADDAHSRERDALRNAYMQFRSTVAPLAGEIARSMPMFTDHSIEHVDALWDIASIICGEDYPINPLEAFVLGGAFLLHDLGMGLVAYPGGLDDVKDDPLFEDYLEVAKNKMRRAQPHLSHEGIEDVARDETVATILRIRHAKRAERLVRESFELPDKSTFYLLQDANLRQAAGPLIGKIAHSHWFDVSELPKEFGQVKGSLTDYPSDWFVDPLKIACILRVADAAHIDSRRAPTYLHAFRKPSGVSKAHWVFQQRLTRPRLVADRLEYTATYHFDADEVAAWWLAYETIGMIDRELRRVDALCADLNRERFAARSVAGAGSPDRLAHYLPTNNWVPVDASLRVSDVPQVVATLGGSALYGSQRLAPLRELVANASDATRARQLLHGGGDAAVTISVLAEDDGSWLEVADHGIGMSDSFLVNCLTDFGKSFWQSTELVSRNPQLLARGFRSTGRFGIGFFAVFMLGDYVQVRSLEYFDNPSNTQVLEFRNGLQTRPLLRNARPDERIQFGGTVVRVKLKRDPFHDNDGFLYEPVLLRDRRSHLEILRTAVARLCALADVDIEVRTSITEAPTRVIRANDWRHMPAGELFDRLYGGYKRSPRTEIAYQLGREHFAKYAAPLHDADGEVVGRLALSAPNVDDDSDDDELYERRVSPPAYLFIGGLRANDIRGMTGAAVGFPVKADRSLAGPVATFEDFERWAQSQESLLESLGSYPAGLRVAHVPRFFGLPVASMPGAQSAAGSLSLTQLASWAEDRTEVRLLDGLDVWTVWRSDHEGVTVSFRTGDKLVIPDDVLLVDFDLDHWLPDVLDPQHAKVADIYGEAAAVLEDHLSTDGALSTPRFVFDAIATAWGMSIPDLLLNADDLTFKSEDNDNRVVLHDIRGRKAAFMTGLKLTRPRVT